MRCPDLDSHDNRDEVCMAVALLSPDFVCTGFSSMGGVRDLNTHGGASK